MHDHASCAADAESVVDVTLPLAMTPARLTKSRRAGPGAWTEASFVLFVSLACSDRHMCIESSCAGSGRAHLPCMDTPVFDSRLERDLRRSLVFERAAGWLHAVLRNDDEARHRMRARSRFPASVSYPCVWAKRAPEFLSVIHERC
jgi:hypothetical protein